MCRLVFEWNSCGHYIANLNACKKAGKDLQYGWRCYRENIFYIKRHTTEFIKSDETCGRRWCEDLVNGYTCGFESSSEDPCTEEVTPFSYLGDPGRQRIGHFFETNDGIAAHCNDRLENGHDGQRRKLKLAAYTYNFISYSEHNDKLVDSDRAIPLTSSPTAESNTYAVDRYGQPIDRELADLQGDHQYVATKLSGHRQEKMEEKLWNDYAKSRGGLPPSAALERLGALPGFPPKSRDQPPPSSARMPAAGHVQGMSQTQTAYSLGGQQASTSRSQFSGPPNASTTRVQTDDRQFPPQPHRAYPQGGQHASTSRSQDPSGPVRALAASTGYGGYAATRSGPQQGHLRESDPTYPHLPAAYRSSRTAHPLAQSSQAAHTPDHGHGGAGAARNQEDHQIQGKSNQGSWYSSSKRR